MKIRAFTPLLLLLPGLAAAASVSGVVQAPDGGPPTNAVVYLQAAPARPGSPPEPLVIEQHQLRFSPRVAVVQVGQRVVFLNGDLMGHNVFSAGKQGFNLGIYPPGARKEHVFTQPGVVALLCNLHPDMSAFLVVVNTPYFYRVGPNGRFLLRDVPAGRHELVVWREGAAELRVQVDTASALPLTLRLKKAD